jgi:hypothetical protein
MASFDCGISWGQLRNNSILYEMWDDHKGLYLLIPLRTHSDPLTRCNAAHKYWNRKKISVPHLNGTENFIPVPIFCGVRGSYILWG